MGRLMCLVAGNSHSRIHSYYRETDWLHEEMANADERLRRAGLVEVESNEEDWFPSRKMRKGMIGDDHVPVRSVPSFSLYSVNEADSLDSSCSEVLVSCM